jgi:uncharacterized tellurite resistance protein B-like protein
MRVNKEKLYEAFGELIYVLAMADGKIQESEKDALQQLINQHPLGADIKWSFDYEARKASNVQDTYKKVLNTCQAYGPTEDYLLLIDLLKQVAEASQGIDEEEQAVVDNFQSDLIARFIEDTKTI